MTTNSFRKWTLPLTAVANAEACFDACASDFKCLAYVFNAVGSDNEGCNIHDFMGQSAAEEDEHRTEERHNYE